MSTESDDHEITFFAPIRPTVVQALRPGDELVVPAGQGEPFSGVTSRGRVTDICGDEASRMITVNGELIGDASGLFEKPAYPGEILQRLLKPGDPPPGEASILVRGVDLWKWIGATMNVSELGGEQFVLRTWRRVHDEEIDGEAIEIRMQSLWNPKKTVTQTATLDSTIGFKGYR